MQKFIMLLAVTLSFQTFIINGALAGPDGAIRNHEQEEDDLIAGFVNKLLDIFNKDEDKDYIENTKTEYDKVKNKDKDYIENIKTEYDKVKEEVRAQRSDYDEFIQKIVTRFLFYTFSHCSSMFKPECDDPKRVQELKNQDYKIFDNFMKLMERNYNNSIEVANHNFGAVPWYESEDPKFVDIFVKYGLRLEEKKEEYANLYKELYEKLKERKNSPEYKEKYKPLDKYNGIPISELTMSPEDGNLFCAKDKEIDNRIPVLKKMLRTIRKYQEIRLSRPRSNSV